LISIFAVLAIGADACATDGYFDAAWPPGSGGGRITFTPGQAFNSATGLAFQNDGKFVLAVTTSTGELDFSNYTVCLVRLQADGSYDYGFGPSKNGRACFGQFPGLPAKPSLAGLHSLLIQGDGKIVLGGTFIDDLANNKASAFVLRLTSDGSALDTDAADGAGFVTFQYGTQSGVALSTVQAAKLQSDGYIVVGGSGCRDAVNPCNEDMALARFDTSLHLDSNFNSNGRELINFDLGGNQNDIGTALALQADGKIVIGGYVDTAAGSQGALARVKSDGTLDMFGNQGRFHFSINGAILLYALAIDANGKLVCVGTGNPSGSPNDVFLAARILADGSSLDAGFGGLGAGYTGTPSGAALIGFSAILSSAQDLDVQARDVAIQSDGRIVVVGYANEVIDSSNHVYFGVARLLPDVGALDLSFGISGRGLGTFGVTTDSSYGQAAGFAPGNHLMVAGYDQPSYTATTADAGLARLNTDLIFWGGFEAPTDNSNRPD
jgi:uncharacterized delta-60 repeat protein